jgi:diaminopimelate epimerase
VQIVRSHGLGNDYLVLDGGPAVGPELARALCDRHRGVGGDGVLEAVHSDRADYGLRIWNPDGSTAEKSGNGLRIFARYLVDHCLAPLDFTVEVPGGVVRCTVDGASGDVRVEMGRATFVPDEIPCAPGLHAGELEVAGQRLTVFPVGLGNPHCVVFVDGLASGGDLDALPWRAWGRALEVHPAFPRRTNVQLARVIDRHTVDVRVWERGAGETQASGSSACAVAAVGVRLGRLHSPVAVRMPGGALEVGVDAELGLTLSGPVEEICVVQTTRRFP